MRNFRTALTCSVAIYCALPGAVQAANVAVVTAGDVVLGIDELGRLGSVTGLNVNGVGYTSFWSGIDGSTNSNSQNVPPFLNLIIADTTSSPLSGASMIAPTGFSSIGSNQYRFSFDHGITVTVELTQYGANTAIPGSRGYARLKVVALDKGTSKDVRALAWGPLPAALSDEVGDTAGVIYNRDFAIGMMGLNTKTNGGIPPEYYAQYNAKWNWPGGDGAPTQYARNTIAYSAARILANGKASLQAFTMDYTTARTSTYGFGGIDGHQRTIEALAGADAEIVGSSVAIYGVARAADPLSQKNLREQMRASILQTVEQIEKDQGLPYVTAGGVWAKSSTESIQRVIEFAETNSGNIATAVAKAREGGFRHIYNWQNSNGVFKDASPFFTPSGSYSQSLSVLKSASDQARSNYRTFGTHTLTGFVFVGSPVANSSADVQVTGNVDKLLERGRGELQLGASASDNSIEIVKSAASASLFNRLLDIGWSAGTTKYGFAAIGNEIIVYTGIDTSGANIRLTGILRGRYGTAASAHSSGAAIRSLEWWPGYEALAWDDGYAASTGVNLANVVNGGGMDFVSMDGIENFVQGKYRQLSLSKFYKSLSDSLTSREFTSEGSIVTPYSWHLHNRFMWGENPGQALKQQARYRFSNIPYYRRNLLPAGLGGWYWGDSSGAGDVHWTGSHVAALNAGVQWRGRQDSTNSSYFSIMKSWIEATEQEAIPDLDRARMLHWEDSGSIDNVTAGRAWKIWELPLSTTQVINADGQSVVNSVTYSNRGDPRYVARPVGGYSAVNVAGDATIVTSSIDNAAQNGAKVVDGFSDVDFDDVFYSQQGNTSWLPSSSDSAPTLTMTWTRPQKVQSIVLHDYAGTQHNMNSLRITFGDGSYKDVTLYAAGDAVVVPIDNKSTSSLTFTTLSKTGNGGLAEISVIAEKEDTRAKNISAGKLWTFQSGIGSSEILSDGTVNSGWPNFVDIGGGKQAITVDLGANFMVDGLRIWRYYDDARNYASVVYQIADNPNFTNATTVFNSDDSNAHGLGTGSDFTFSEKSYGHPVYFAPVEGRYVRLLSNGSSANGSNHYVEAQIFGKRNLLKNITPTTHAGASISNPARASDAAVSDATSVATLSNGDYIQFDLGSEQIVDALRVWHRYDQGQRMRAIVWQVSTDPSFASNVTTLFNNDFGNVQGLGIGRDAVYSETASGKVVEFAPTRARYLRLYNGGNAQAATKDWVEVQLYDAVNLVNGLRPTFVSSTGESVLTGWRVTDGVIDTSLTIDIGTSKAITFDLGSEKSVDALRVWRNWSGGRTYRDVIYQISNDPSFASGVTTVFNNDTDNSSGYGSGSDSEFSETAAGHLKSFTAVKGRYVRLISNGSSAGTSNEYTEVKIYGR